MFALSDSFRLPGERLINICKYRQKDCCKYIIFFEKKNEFYCVKNVPELREKIDSQDHLMTAQGDNCEGLIDETESKSSGTSQ